jgi:hypothetical protein
MSANLRRPWRTAKDANRSLAVRFEFIANQFARHAPAIAQVRMKQLPQQFAIPLS